ncbi:MAG: PHB depolymerase family esterase, partial [Pseudomonadota bacterium]
LHGFLGTGTSIRKKTSFDALARAQGFVAAYPDGERRRWNDGRARNRGVDDVAFIAALIARLTRDGRADPERVFLAGRSNGGGMALRIACDRPDLVRGIAVIATNTLSDFRCAQNGPTPAIFFHGAEDPIAPPEGRPPGHRFEATLSADATLALWASRNGCGAVARSQRIDRLEDDASAEILDYGGCEAPLRYVVISGHGHGWPGARARFRRVMGPSTLEIDAAAESWRFFAGL